MDWFVLCSVHDTRNIFLWENLQLNCHMISLSPHGELISSLVNTELKCSFGLIPLKPLSYHIPALSSSIRILSRTNSGKSYNLLCTGSLGFEYRNAFS